MNKFRIKRFVFRLVFVLIYLPVLTFVIGEIASRIYVKVKQIDMNSYLPSFLTGERAMADRRRFTDHPFLPFMTVPFDSRILTVYKKAIGKTVTYTYTNNSLGFRTPERPYEKQANVKRIVTLGGSTTWDGPTNDTTWPALLEKKLNEYYKNSGYSVEVINLALDAGIAQTSLGILEMYGIQFHPDLVISYDGVNDLWFSMYTGNILPDYSNYVRPFDPRIRSLALSLPDWAFRSYFLTFTSSAIDRTFHLAGYLPDQVWQQSPTVTDKVVSRGLPLYLRNIRLMRGVCREYWCAFAASIPHWTKPHDMVLEFDRLVREDYAAQGINYLDLQSLLPHDDYTIHVDEFHFTEKGLDMTAQSWAEKIIQENLLTI